MAVFLRVQPVSRGDTRDVQSLHCHINARSACSIPQQTRWLIADSTLLKVIFWPSVAPEAPARPGLSLNSGCQLLTAGAGAICGLGLDEQMFGRKVTSPARRAKRLRGGRHEDRCFVTDIKDVPPC